MFSEVDLRKPLRFKRTELTGYLRDNSLQCTCLMCYNFIIALAEKILQNVHAEISEFK